MNVKSRTLRAEIDLHNPDSRILPGMYAYAKVIIERPGVWSVPVARPSSHSGEKTFCWTYEDGHANGSRWRRGSATASGSRSPIVQPPTASNAGDPLDAGQRLGAGDPRRPVDPRRRPAVKVVPGTGRPCLATASRSVDRGTAAGAAKASSGP